MARPHSIPPGSPQAERALTLKRRGLSYVAIAGKLRVHPTTVGRFFRAQDGEARKAGMPSTVQQAGPAAMDRWDGDNPEPKVYADLSVRAKECLEDFPRFCAEILGEPLHAHQERWFAEQEASARAGNLFNMRNVHPRSGKTDLDTKRCIWLFCGGGHPHEWYLQADPPLRDTRIMLVAGSENQSDKNFEYIQIRLSEHGRLIQEYGRFRITGNVWRPSQGVLTIDGRRRLMLSGDYSLVCVGTGTHVLGRGADHIICDDPFDAENTKSGEQAERGLRWLRASIFGRLEPGGTVTVLGARLPVPSEPYTAMSKWPGDIDFEAEGDERDLDEESDDYPRLFATVVEPAVLDWEQKKVLCPERFSWRNLMKARRLAGHDVWEASWMQNPQATDSTLARREWIYGGNGIDPTSKMARTFPGCMDPDRTVGQTTSVRVRKAEGSELAPSIRVVSVDPSDVKWWGIWCIDLFKVPGGEFRPVCVDLDRNKHNTASFLALLGVWWEAHHFSVLLLEKNMAKFLLENEKLLDFCRERGIKILRHYTGDNRNHPVWGVGMLRDDIMEGRIRIPNADYEARATFLYFIREALGELATDDTLLSLWFVKFNLAGLLALASSGTGWPGWKGSPGRHRRPPARVGKYWAGAA